MEIPCAENILEMPGIGERILSGILAEMGDIDRFDDVREIQKLSGMGLVACSSGKHKGETKISHRGRKKTQVSRHPVYGQAGRRKLEHDSIRHGRFAAIAIRACMAFIIIVQRMLN